MKINKKISILLIDDEEAALFGLKKTLSGQGYKLAEAGGGVEGLEKATDLQPDIVITDMVMPDLDGIELIKKLSKVSSPPLIILTTAFGSENIAVEAMRAGAYDYLSKPYEIDELKIIVANAAEKILLERENKELRAQLKKSDDGVIIGSSDAMREVMALVDKVSLVDVTVLIRGESGTGKELVARAIYSGSSRAKKSFVAINCAAIPSELMESELFGHVKGAFTGATHDRKGKFELADGGILFLDEIGDMALETQAKILRVIQEGVFEPLGSSEERKSDVRIVSATHKDLQKGIKEGWFREDLYFRTKVVEIYIPPLRERHQDISALVEHFIQKFNIKHDKKINSIEPTMLEYLVSSKWPGNIRQLMNVIEEAVALSDGTILKLSKFITNDINAASNDYTAGDLDDLSFKEAKQNLLNSFEKKFFIEALKRNKGNISRTASSIGIRRQYLQEKLKELDIHARLYKN